MEPESITLVAAIVVPVLTVGAAWGGTVVGVNGTKKKLDEVSDTVKEIDARTRKNEVSLGRVEQRQVGFEQRLDRAETA